LERIEATLSSWTPQSATSRFNANASIEEQNIPEELGRLIELAQRLSRSSAGAYDITVGPLVGAWGYGPQGEVSTPPSDTRLKELLEAVGWEKLTLSSDATHLRKSHPLVSLDLGSVLQGYAVDRLCALLDAAGYVSYLVEVGGEFRAKGAWKVAIENPDSAQKPLTVLELKDAALATSGLARARKRLAGKTVSHIISPHTGAPVKPTIEVCSVMSPTCLEADGWATTLIASGMPEAESLCEREQLDAWILDAAGRFQKFPPARHSKP
jgi:thiamine biosynthesis lipoprotein